MWLFRERLSDFREKKIANSPRVNQIVHRVDNLICTPISNHLRSHFRAIMALDHNRLGLENKLGRIFLCWTSLLYKTLLTNLEGMWNSTMRRCFYHTDLGQNAVFHNFEIKMHPFNIQDDRSTRGLLAKPLKKFPKSHVRPARYELGSVWMNINRVML